MSTGKISIFITVVSLHACVLGLVYVSTREPQTVSEDTTGSTVKNSTDTGNGKTPAQISRQKPDENGDEPRYHIHTVAPNDYLGKIADHYNVPWKSIVKINNLADPNRLRRGQKLKIPLN